MQCAACDRAGQSRRRTAMSAAEIGAQHRDLLRSLRDPAVKVARRSMLHRSLTESDARSLMIVVVHMRRWLMQIVPRQARRRALDCNRLGGRAFSDLAMRAKHLFACGLLRRSARAMSDPVASKMEVLPKEARSGRLYRAKPDQTLVVTSIHMKATRSCWSRATALGRRSTGRSGSAGDRPPCGNR